jgi:ABC-type glycerol-3-phosphate transport system substrate-binding protein
MIRTAFTAAALLALSACGGQTESDNTAAALENAASQSTPEAAAVLENAAEQIQEQNIQAPISEPGSPGQRAMEAAGKAQVQGSGAPKAPPSVQAKPHAPGDPVPPPKVGAEGNHAGGH